jgi:hypothetical protein
MRTTNYYDSTRIMAEAAPRELPPPGDTGVELEGGAAIAAFRNQLARRHATQTPRVPLTVVQLDLWREGNTVIAKVAFGKVGAVTIRLSAFWARTLMLKLQKVMAP